MYKKVKFYSHPCAKWVWPVEFMESKIFKFLIFLTETDKKLDTGNFRMIVQVKIIKRL